MSTTDTSVAALADVAVQSAIGHATFLKGSRAFFRAELRRKRRWFLGLVSDRTTPGSARVAWYRALRKVGGMRAFRAEQLPLFSDEVSK